jgi:hypothetical protein
MATGQSLLDRMELLDPELQLQTGETDVTRGLLALNVAQDHFESVVAVRPNTLGGAYGTVATASSVEVTAFPTGVLRIDDLWMLDNSLPSYKLDDLHVVGSHRQGASWFYNLVASGTSTGKPSAYWTNGSNIFWSPLPGAIYSVRWYGFQAAADITASGTFAYPDIVMLPMAVFATRILTIGLDDGQQDLNALAQETFAPVIDALSNFNRTGASGFNYERPHDT